MFFLLSCVCYAFVSVCLYVPCGHTCWERAYRLALVCGVQLWGCHFPIGILGQVWYFIVLIPHLCTLTYFSHQLKHVVWMVKNASRIHIRRAELRPNPSKKC